MTHASQGSMRLSLVCIRFPVSGLDYELLLEQLRQRFAVHVQHFQTEQVSVGGRFVDQLGVVIMCAGLDVGAPAHQGGLDALLGQVAVGGTAEAVVGVGQRANLRVSSLSSSSGSS